MPRIPEDELTRIKQEVSLLERVRAEGIALQRFGVDWLGRCPFHEDTNPSLVITPSKNLWHCLGACRAGGSVIDWVMRREGLSFRHAVERLRAALPDIQPPTVISPSPGSARPAAVTSFATRWQRSCWKVGPISAPFRRCWGTRS